MKTEWDYTKLADAYLKRADYAQSVIDELIRLSGLKAGDKVCDVGAGVAHLTLMLAEKEFDVHAVEPNDAMRLNGIERTKTFNNVTWSEGTGEHTGQPSQTFDLVTFGSSFNVCDRQKALVETQRILKPAGWFACCWNHRQLDDPLQKEIELIITSYVENYDYGTRREDQTSVIEESHLFNDVHYLEGVVKHEQSVVDCIEAWRSHGTLERQAGEQFNQVVDAIAAFLKGLGRETIIVPYQTKMWAAQLKTV